MTSSAAVMSWASTKLGKPSTQLKEADIKAITALGGFAMTVEGEQLVFAEKELRRVVSELAGDVPVEVDAFVGDPAETLVDLSARMDLLVCGSRGYGPVRAVLLGSVSRRVVGEARCPVIVLPRGVKASLESLMEEVPGAAAPAG